MRDTISPFYVRPEVIKSGNGWSSPALLIAGVMLLTIFEGALRKWVFSSNPLLRYAAYFSKDILFFYAGYLGWRRGVLFDMSWLYLCAAFIIVPSAGATLMSSNAVGVFLSLRAYLLIPACAYLAASLVRDFRDIERCAVLLAVAAIAVAVLSSYQYYLPASHVLNRYDASTEDSHIVAVFGHVRATGTFSYISGMSMLARVCGWAGMILSLPLPGRSLWLRLIGAGGLAAGFVCASTAMSLGGLIFWAASILGSCLLYFRPKQMFAAFLAVLLVSPFLTGGGEQVSYDTASQSKSLTIGLEQRLSDENAVSDRASYVLMNLYLGVMNHPLGEGLGLGQGGGQYVAGDQSKRIESAWGRVAFEIGPFGLAAVLFIRFSACRECWRRLVVTADDRTRLVMATTLPYFGLMSLGWMAFNHTGNSFAWSVMALALGAASNFGRSTNASALHSDLVGDFYGEPSQSRLI